MVHTLFNSQSRQQPALDVLRPAMSNDHFQFILLLFALPVIDKHFSSLREYSHNLTVTYRQFGFISYLHQVKCAIFLMLTPTFSSVCSG